LQIEVSGVDDAVEWSCALRFLYENEESFTVELGTVNGKQSLITTEAEAVQLAFLPPMLGLVAVEDRLERGSIQRRIGEGRTAEVLRNLCYQIYESSDKTGLWEQLQQHIQTMFAVE